MPTPIRVLIVFMALVLAGFGVQAGIKEVRAYQALKQEHLLLLGYLGESLGTSTDENGKQTPITRADVLNAIVLATLKNAETSK